VGRLPPLTSSAFRVRFWVESLEATCATIADAGFVIERLAEPRPRPDAAGAQSNQ